MDNSEETEISPPREETRITVSSNHKRMPSPINREEAKAIFPIDVHVVSLIQESPFFAALSWYIRKVPTRDIPTAGIAYDPVYDELAMYYNPEFMAPKTKLQVKAILVHELYHVVFEHVTSRRREPHYVWNIATDLAINSLIVESYGKGDHEATLPDGLYPGLRPKYDQDPKNELTKEQKEAATALADLIENFPVGKASEWYFDRLMEVAQQHGEGMMGLGIVPLDDHDLWDSLSEEARERIKTRVKALVERAVRHADSTSNGWGSIPASTREEIRKLVSNTVDWRAVLRQFVGFSLRGDRAKSIKKINKRYPYIHPGVKRGYLAKLLIAVDQSGSVDDASLSLVSGELSSLTRHVTIDVVAFDTEVDRESLFTWRKGQALSQFKRTRCGGTNFDAPTQFVGAPENKGRWDALLIVTDGECCAPQSSVIRRAYAIVPGRKLLFDTTDTVISLEKIQE